MDRREAIAKATTTTTVATDGMLAPEQSRAFLRTIKDKGTLSQKIRLETPTPSSGEINKLSTGARLIRAAVENADDGYRAQPTLPDGAIPDGEDSSALGGHRGRLPRKHRG